MCRSMVSCALEEASYPQIHKYGLPEMGGTATVGAYLIVLESRYAAGSCGKPKCGDSIRR